MELTSFASVETFLGMAGDFLIGAEAENNLILGICSSLEGGDSADVVPYLAAVTGSGRVQGVAVMTAGRRLALTRSGEEVLEMIARDLDERGIPPPGVIGPVEVATRFSELWRQKSGSVPSLDMEMRIFQLERVISPEAVPGRLRRATVDDSDLMAAWSVAFMRESLGVAGDPATVERSAIAGIEEGRLYVWEDILPVSMAAWVGPTPNGVRINYVYTPPELRGRGYASACVAALSQNRLDSGRRFCFLYTDLSNPTSNSIYRKIGYQPVTDVCAYNFTYPTVRVESR